jgi:GT2 family glycosyltransferase
MKMNPKITITIVNFNGFLETINCLKSLEKMDYSNFNIIVIENGSENESFSELRKYIDKEKKLNIRLIKSLKNLGFAGGHNLAIRKSKDVDYFFLLNPDTTLKKDCLAKLVEIAEENKFNDKKIGFLGPRIFYEDEKTIYSNGGHINKNLIKAMLKDHGKIGKDLIEKVPFKTDYVTGTALLVSKEVIEDVGIMRENYFLYYEDSDWSLRATKKGYIHLIVPGAILYHKGYHSTEYLSFNYIYYLTRNGYYLAWWNGVLLNKIFVLLYSFYKLIKQIFKMLIPSKRKWIKPITKATVDFWKGRVGKI